jgi:hypothetical protein
VIVFKGKYMVIVTSDRVDEWEVEECDGDDDNDANATSVWNIASSDVLGWSVGVVL